MMSLQQGIEEIEDQEADDEKRKGEHRDYSNRRKVSSMLAVDPQDEHHESDHSRSMDRGGASRSMGCLSGLQKNDSLRGFL
jgi:hypothetical protein